jgi:hypothetical protein
MLYTCDDPQFAGAFVEFSEQWSVRQRRALITETGEEYVQLLAAKIEALHLPAVEGEPITEPAQFNQENIDRIDIRLFEWVRRQTVQLLVDLAELGEAYRRRLYGTSEEKAEAE